MDHRRACCFANVVNSWGASGEWTCLLGPNLSQCCNAHDLKHPIIKYVKSVEISFNAMEMLYVICVRQVDAQLVESESDKEIETSSQHANVKRVNNQRLTEAENVKK